MNALGNVLRFEALRGELQAVADQVAIRFARSSLSPVIREYLGFSTAVCLPDGRMLAQGGLVVRRSLEVLAPEALLNLRTHRNRTPPYGLQGGRPGATSATWLVREGERTQLPAKTTVLVKHGDLVIHHTAAGGGMGDPHERDRAAIEHDVREGKVSLEAARELYGWAPENSENQGAYSS